MNPATLKIKGSPSDVFNRGKSNQERKLTGTELPVVSGIRSGTDSRLFRKEKKGKERRKVGTKSSFSCSFHRIFAERHPRSFI